MVKAINHAAEAAPEGEGEANEQVEQLQPTDGWIAFISNRMINGKRTHEGDDNLQGN